MNDQATHSRLDALCEDCGLWQRGGCRSPNIPPSGAEQPRVYVVGMAPGPEEDQRNENFVGAAGKLIRNALEKVKVPLDQVRFSNAVRCLPPENKPTSREVGLCSQRVREDIRRTQPQVVLVLGGEAVTGLWPSRTGPAISFNRGNLTPFPLDETRTVETQYIPAVVTFHPSYILRGQRHSEDAQVWLDDVYKVPQLLEAPETPIAYARRSRLLDPPAVRQTLETEADLEAFFTVLKGVDVVAWDYETTQLSPFPRRDGTNKYPPALFSCAWAFDGTAYVVPLWDYWPAAHLKEILRSIALWLLHTPGQVKIAHNMKFEFMWSVCQPFVQGLGWHPRDAIRALAQCEFQFEDTMLLSWLYDERPARSALKNAAWARLGVEDWGIEFSETKCAPDYPLYDVLAYNQDDAWWTLKLWAWAHTHVTDRLRFVFEGVTRPASFAFADVELHGTPVDESERQRLIGLYQGQMKAIQDQADRLAPRVSITSTQQLSDYFSGVCRYQMLRRNKDKKGKPYWSTDEKSLEHLIATYRDPVAALVLQYRKFQKLDSTYLSGLDRLIARDNRLHGSYKIAGPVTGRTSSTDPNMQNFPVRTDEGRRIRGIVGSPPDYVVCSSDYGQIEARLFAATSGSVVFIQELFKKFDQHLENARFLFGDDRAKALRVPVKSATFALFYGSSMATAAETAGTSIEDAALLDNHIKAKYPEVFAWRDWVVAFYAQHGYVESLFGRRRRAPMSYNELINETNQSTASDMTLVSMNRLWREYQVGIMIHDDLTFFLKNDAYLSERLMHIALVMLSEPWRFISSSPHLKAYVPLSVEFKLGPNWCDLRETVTVHSQDVGMYTLDDALRACEVLDTGGDWLSLAAAA